MRRGIIGIDYEMLELRGITNISIDVGYWDSKYGTGTPTLKALGVSPVKLEAVPDPVTIQRLISKAVEEARRAG